jgi:Dihaem cytochrome c
MSNSFGLIVTRILQSVTLLAAMGCTAAFLSDSDDDAGPKKNAGKSIAFVENKTYQTECTSCHVGFLPGFLPERSWKKLMGDLENHFGENASLENPAKDELIKYLTSHAADKPGATPRSKRIAKMISLSDAPIRITETPFWTRKHSSIRAYVWKREKVGGKSHCDSCHRDANKGIFTEHDVHIPKA